MMQFDTFSNVFVDGNKRQCPADSIRSRGEYAQESCSADGIPCRHPRRGTVAPPIDMAETFLRHVHTGQQLRAEDWLSEETRSSEAFIGFGGLDVLVRQSTARADRYGGVKAVRIRGARGEGGEYFVTAEVLFNRDPTAGDGPAMATHDQMIWEFRVVREEGKWKLAL